MKISHLVPTGEPSRNPAIQRPRSNSLDGIQTVFDKPRSGWIDEMRNARWAQYHMEQVSVSDALVGPDQPLTKHEQQVDTKDLVRQVHKKNGPNTPAQRYAQVQTKVKMKSKGTSTAPAHVQSKVKMKSKGTSTAPAQVQTKVKIKSKGMSTASAQFSKKTQAKVIAQRITVGVDKQLLAESSLKAAKQLVTSKTTHQSQAKEIVEIASLSKCKAKKEQELFYLGVLPLSAFFIALFLMQVFQLGRNAPNLPLDLQYSLE